MNRDNTRRSPTAHRARAASPRSAAAPTARGSPRSAAIPRPDRRANPRAPFAARSRPARRDLPPTLPTGRGKTPAKSPRASRGIRKPNADGSLHGNRRVSTVKANRPPTAHRARTASPRSAAAPMARGSPRSAAIPRTGRRANPRAPFAARSRPARRNLPPTLPTGRGKTPARSPRASRKIRKPDADGSLHGNRRVSTGKANRRRPCSTTPPTAKAAVP